MLSGKSFSEYVETLKTDMVVSVRGRANNRDDGRSIAVYSVNVLDAPSAGEYTGKIHVQIENEKANRETLERLNYILKQHSGASEFIITITNDGSTRTFTLPQKVRYSVEFIGELKVLLGANSIVRGDQKRTSESAPGESTDEVVALEVEQRTLFDS
jgi:DNA polymerase III alpha subunit